MGMEWLYKIRTVTFYICFELVCFALLKDQEEFRAVTVLGSNIGVLFPDQNFHYLVGSPVAQVRGLRYRRPGLRVGAPPKAITLLPLPQPVLRFHPIVVLRRRVPALQLNPIQHQYLDK